MQVGRLAGAGLTGPRRCRRRRSARGRALPLVGVNPALDSSADLAAELGTTAEREAAEHGRLLSSTRVAA
ncbi:hypothetical protein [Modestobacter excelsi]|uniref:hypothetical protein n=1 Tax=Modestobacter excelsi TaxID=2213161 RepID=UPI001C20E6F0|nr:hypothetical protein [Modestobacter excelsi]